MISTRNYAPRDVHSAKSGEKLGTPNVYKPNSISTTRQTISPNEGKNQTKVAPSTLKKTPNSLFRKWAFSKAEHPKIDLTKLNENPTPSFTQKERDIVAKFLENVKSDLQNNK